MLLGWRAKIGQIRPATAIEGAEEWRSVAPTGVAFADARTIVPKVDQGGLKVMMSQVLEASRQLATAKVDLIVQCGAPGTFLEGPAADERITSEITAHTGIPAITMQQSAVKALQALGASTVAVATIYTDEVNDALAASLESHGIKVSAIEGLQMTDPYDASTHDADSAYRLGKSVYKKAGGADAILISCGTYRTFETLPYLEMDTGAAVVSSNQSTLWNALRTLGLPDVIPDLGRLWTVA
ncbi:aspartate/glutamate racemase family protein [Saccharopolyspora sp. ASAGF58]|uniref:maleate cis-trans isomerase family protein n=1 Tax=Saccharopolyspora sp. ASAGF58 TaxID=2719023 RepID=UPI00143FC800|nr:aspartate/glutamate racemase family protein [Saccharopolyspora sp. ASAGF58]QIZ38618.1 decarboxylase [Saccharopolyspora sp. ASAGF58]